MSQNFFERYSKTVLSCVMLLFLSMALVSLEVILRLSGEKLSINTFSQLDDLIVSDEFQTDQYGIFKANPSATTRVSGMGKMGNINQDGFRGPEFRFPDSEEESILILGDSFAWGNSAEPLTKSFPDLLRKAGYRVYNTGIPGVGPTQYEAIAKLYIPQFKPNHVLVALFMGNDLKEKPDPRVPRHNLYHITNREWFWGFDKQGRPRNLKTAYEDYASSLITQVRLKFYTTLVGERLWFLLRWFRSGLIKSIDYLSWAVQKEEGKSTKYLKKYAHTFKALKSIQEMTENSGAQYHLLIIPNKGKGCGFQGDRPEFYQSFFQTSHPIYLDEIPANFYKQAMDCHLNTQGHGMVVKKILSTLNSQDTTVKK